MKAQLGEDLGEMSEQLRKQVARVQELRIKKVLEPGEFIYFLLLCLLMTILLLEDAFYGTEDTSLHNVDVMTDVSMAPTAFTRYTIAPSATSKASK